MCAKPLCFVMQYNIALGRSIVRDTCRSSLQPVYRGYQAEPSDPYGTRRFHRRICKKTGDG